MHSYVLEVDEWEKAAQVLILVLMEDALVRTIYYQTFKSRRVLILVLMEDALVLYMKIGMV